MTVLVYDLYRFTSFFAATIAEYPAMIRQVALPFAPLECKLYQLFHDPHELPTVVGGYQQKWFPSLRIFPKRDENVICVAFLHDEDTSKVVSTSAPKRINEKENHVLRCWDVATGTEAIRNIKLESVSIAQFSPDGAEIWVATGDGSILVINAATGEQLLKLTPKSWATMGLGDASGATTHDTMLDSNLERTIEAAGFTRAIFSSDHKWVIFGDNIGKLYVVNRKAEKQPYNRLDDCSKLRDRQGERVRMSHRSLAFSPDGKVFAAGSGDGKIHVWRTESVRWQKLAALEGHSTEVTLVAFSSDGDKLYSASDDGQVRIWDRTQLGTNSANIGGFVMNSGLQPIAVSPDGRVASTTKHGTIQLWNAITGEEVSILQGHFNNTSTMSFSQNGTQLVSGAYQNEIRLWDVSRLKNNELIEFSRHDRPPHEVAFSPSGLVVRSSRPDETKFWSVITGRELNMDPYDISANFLPQIEDGNDNATPDILTTSSGGVVTLVDSLPNGELTVLERKWEAAAKAPNPRVQNRRWEGLRIICPTSNAEVDQEIWRVPSEFHPRDHHDIRSPFATFGLKNGRVVIVHIPEKRS